MKTFLTLVLASSVIALDTPDSIALEPGDEPTTELVPFSEVEWEQLNPARGDKSPQAGTLWGDRKGTLPTGFLASFVDGFSSPPHIHNATYRAVVISGLIHNDDPDAADMWMPAGSFWTQPKGEVHITAARGSTNVALVEIDKGPYLVLPVEEAFDSGERPINVDVSNVVWVDLPGVPDSSWVPQVAYLWGSMRAGQSNGSFLKLPAGFTGKIHSRGSTFRAVVIQGTPQYKVPGKAIAKALEPGSYFGSRGEAVHQIWSEAGKGTIVYVRTDGTYDIIPVQP
mgnify:CR=1 FL=1